MSARIESGIGHPALSLEHERIFHALSPDVVAYGLSMLVEEKKDEAWERDNANEAAWYHEIYSGIGTLVDPANLNNQRKPVGDREYRSSVELALRYMKFVGFASTDLSINGIQDAYARAMRIDEADGKPAGVIFLFKRRGAEFKISRAMKKRRALAGGIEGKFDIITFEMLDRLSKRYKKLPSYSAWQRLEEERVGIRYRSVRGFLGRELVRA